MNLQVYYLGFLLMRKSVHKAGFSLSSSDRASQENSKRACNALQIMLDVQTGSAQRAVAPDDECTRGSSYCFCKGLTGSYDVS